MTFVNHLESLTLEVDANAPVNAYDPWHWSAFDPADFLFRPYSRWSTTGQDWTGGAGVSTSLFNPHLRLQASSGTLTNGQVLLEAQVPMGAGVDLVCFERVGMDGLGHTDAEFVWQALDGAENVLVEWASEQDSTAGSWAEFLFNTTMTTPATTAYVRGVLRLRGAYASALDVKVRNLGLLERVLTTGTVSTSNGAIAVIEDLFDPGLWLKEGDYETQALPVAPGQWVSADAVFINRDPVGTVDLVFLDVTEAVLSTHAGAVNAGPVTAQAPAGTASARLVFATDTNGLEPESVTVLSALSMTLEDIEGLSGGGVYDVTPWRNLFPNPEATKATFGWTSPVPGSGIEAVDGAFVFTAGAGFTTFTSLPVDVFGNDTLGLFMLGYSSDTAVDLDLSVKFFDVDGAEILHTTPYTRSLPTTGTQQVALSEPIPAAATKAMLVLDVIRSGGAPTAGDSITLSNVRLFTHENGTLVDGVLTSVPTSGPMPLLAPRHRWLDVLADATEIRVDRGELDLGILSARIKGEDLDPSVHTYISPGRALKLCLTSGECIFEGHVSHVEASYLDQTIIDVRALDAVNALANTSEARGVATVDELTHLVEATGAAWSINGYGGQDDSPINVVSVNPNASVVDQIEVTRETNLGYAWVDRTNVLNVFDADQIESTPVATWNEDDYSTIDVGYDSASIINEVTVNFLRYNAQAGTSEEVSYGPYRDKDSVQQWGAVSKTFVIHGASEDPVAIEAYAQAILDANATPTVRAKSLTLPIRDLATAESTGLVDLFDRVTVQYQDRVDATYRVKSLTHTIRPGRWIMAVRFDETGAVQQPTAIPKPTFSGEAGNVSVSGDLYLGGTLHADADLNVGGKVTLTGFESSSDVVIDLGDYDVYADDTGNGTDNTRLWFDAPDGGEVVIGPRAGGNYLNRLRIRGDALIEGDVSAGGVNLRYDEVSISDDGPVRVEWHNSANDWRWWWHVDANGSNFYLLNNQGSGTGWVAPHPIRLRGDVPEIIFDWDVRVKHIKSYGSYADWTDLNLINGWQNYGGSYNNGQFRILADGRVELRGLLKSGTLNNACAVLPTLARPSNTYLTVGMSNGGAGRVDVINNGEIRLRSLFGASNGYFSIDGITFARD